MTDDVTDETVAVVPDRPKLVDREWFQPAILGLLALLSASLLSLGDLATKDAIAERRAEGLRKSLAQVIPDNLHTNDPGADSLSLDYGDTAITVYRALKEGQVTAVAFEMVENGYGGPIQVLIGIAPDGRVLGARVTNHAETPGLGDRIDARKDDWILSFDGRSLGNPAPDQWAVKKDGGIYDQFAGATITPRAVVTAVKKGLELFDRSRAHLLRPPKETEQ